MVATALKTFGAAERFWLANRNSLSRVASSYKAHHAWERSDINGRKQNFCISDEATAQQAIQSFLDQGVGSLLTTNKRGRLSGIVTERDVIRKIGLLNKDASEVEINQIKTAAPKLVITRPHVCLDQCLQSLRDHDLYQLPIVDDAADIVGMITVQDCLRVLMEDNLTIERLEGRAWTEVGEEEQLSETAA